MPSASIEFTDKEIKIAKLICQQMSNQEIAEILDYSVRYIETIRLQMTRKMNVKNSVGIALYAVKKGWVKL
jgi:DNA-binding CsgD family transcriptional regulator